MSQALAAALLGLAWAAGLTVVVECVTSVLLGMRSRCDLAIVALVNLATNPVLNVVMILAAPLLLKTGTWFVALAALEVAVVLVEWRVFAWAFGARLEHPLAFALALNLASLGAGFLLGRFVPGLAWAA